MKLEYIYKKYILIFAIMNWQDLLQALKESTWTENFDNIDDSKYYKWLSWSHTKIAERIKAKVDSKFFYSITKADTVIGQYKYDDLPVNVIDTVFVKYDGDTKYRKCTVTDVSERSESIEELRDNQSKEKPLYFITNDIVMIFPKADSDTVGWLLVTWKNVVEDITTSTPATDLYNWQLATYHDVIVDGAKEYVYEYLQEFNKKAEAEWQFFNEWALALPWSLDKMITEISYRWSQPIAYEDPDLSYLLV